MTVWQPLKSHCTWQKHLYQGLGNYNEIIGNLQDSVQSHRAVADYDELINTQLETVVLMRWLLKRLLVMTKWLAALCWRLVTNSMSWSWLDFTKAWKPFKKVMYEKKNDWYPPHIVFDVDDGPKTREDTRTLLEESYRWGVRTIISTSSSQVYFWNPEEKISGTKKWKKLRQRHRARFNDSLRAEIILLMIWKTGRKDHSTFMRRALCWLNSVWEHLYGDPYTLDPFCLPGVNPSGGPYRAPRRLGKPRSAQVTDMGC